MIFPGLAAAATLVLVSAAPAAAADMPSVVGGTPEDAARASAIDSALFPSPADVTSIDDRAYGIVGLDPRTGVRNLRGAVAPGGAGSPLAGGVGGVGTLVTGPGGRAVLDGRATQLPGRWPAWLPAPTFTLRGDIADASALGLGPGASRRELRETPLPSGTARFEVGGLSGFARHDAEIRRLHLNIPAIGLNRTYPVETAAEARRLVRRLLRRHGDALVGAALRWSAAKTPDDPIAGNPRSLMTNLAFSAGVLATQGPMLRTHATGVDGVAWQEQVAFGGPGFAVGGPAETALPLALSFPVARGVTASVTAPIRYTGESEGQSVSGGVGVGLSVQPLSAWTVGGMLHWGGAAETDRTAGTMIGVSGLSRLEAPVGPLRLSLTSQLSSFRTLPLTLGGMQLDYDLTAYVARNGVGAALPFTATGARDRVGLELAETRFLGADLYIERSMEAALAWTRADARGRDVAGLRLSAGMDDAGGTAVRLGLDLAF